MDALTYFIIAAVLFIVTMVVEVLLAKQDAVKNMSAYDTSDVTIAMMVTLAVAAAWLITIPVGIFALAIYGISRWVTNWLNK